MNLILQIIVLDIGSGGKKCTSLLLFNLNKSYQSDLILQKSITDSKDKQPININKNSFVASPEQSIIQSKLSPTLGGRINEQRVGTKSTQNKITTKKSLSSKLLKENTNDYIPPRPILSEGILSRCKSSITNNEPSSKISADRIQKDTILNIPEINNFDKIEKSDFEDIYGINKFHKSASIEIIDSTNTEKSMRSPDISNLIGQFNTEFQKQVKSSSGWSLHDLEYYDLLNEYDIGGMYFSLSNWDSYSSITLLGEYDSESDTVPYDGFYENLNAEREILLLDKVSSDMQEIESKPDNNEFNFEEIRFHNNDEELIFENQISMSDILGTNEEGRGDVFYDKTTKLKESQFSGDKYKIKSEDEKKKVDKQEHFGKNHIVRENMEIKERDLQSKQEENKVASENEIPKVFDLVSDGNENIDASKYETPKGSKNKDYSENFQPEKDLLKFDKSINGCSVFNN
ncbi:hypothetical protein HZS_7261 [Henneguya salminicola]|nr:hypothetical protein HZS_7261 [Henneguya salminicola]